SVKSMAFSTIKNISSREDWEEAKQASLKHDVVIFKHSNTCLMSIKAMNAIADLEPDVLARLYMIIVQRHRDISNLIAEETGITHESPQLLQLSGGKVKTTAHHYGVTDTVVLRMLGK